MKGKAIKIILSSLLAVGAIALVATPKQSSRGIFYRVTGGKSTLYLLGSIHVGSDNMYPMSQSIQQAMETAEVFVFECDTQSEQAQADMNALLRYGEGDALHNHISVDVYEQVREMSQKTGYGMPMLDGLKPWGIVSMLSTQIAAAQMGESSAKSAIALGVEAYVRKQTRGKSTQYLETAHQQLSVLDGFSPALQEHMLAGACQTILYPEQMSQSDKDTLKWPTWWAEGNAQAFADSYQQGMEADTEPELAKEYHLALVTKRNHAMAHKLQALLEGDKAAFATVGLMHLVLPGDSVLDELQKLGYSVERIEN